MGTVHSDIPFGSFEQLITMNTIVALFVLVAATYANAEAEADPMMMGGFPQAPYRQPSGFVYSYQTYDNYPASTAPLTVPAVAPAEVPAEGTPQAIAPQFIAPQYNPYGAGYGGYPFAGGYNGLYNGAGGLYNNYAPWGAHPYGGYGRYGGHPGGFPGYGRGYGYPYGFGLNQVYNPAIPQRFGAPVVAAAPAPVAALPVAEESIE